MVRIYDTKQHKKVELKTLESGKVKMYVCGPTVYNYIHIGNARTFISFDVIRRYLEWRGYKVTFVQNITDVDDKIITKAHESGQSADKVAREFTQAFIEDMHAINVLDPTVRPLATNEIESMILLIQELIESGHAYSTPEGDVYFDVRSFPSYGSLSGRNIDEMQAGHRDLRAAGLESRKRDELDFALWKATKPGEPAWDSPWGQGRPGWHIECSCMSKKYLGLPFDIHGGGADLIFPHHENERAQSEAASRTRFANFWMHGGMLQINGEKMSKSLDNYFLLRDILTTVDASVLRFLMLQTHYRSPLDFSDARVEEAGVSLERIKNALRNLDWAMSHADGDNEVFESELISHRIDTTRQAFIEAMDDDFNTPKALGVLFDFVTEINSLVAGKTLNMADINAAQSMHELVIELMSVFGIDLARDLAAEQARVNYPVELITLAREIAGYDGDDASDAADVLLDARSRARMNKDWVKADAVRDGMSALGLIIKDTPQGSQIEFTEHSA